MSERLACQALYCFLDRYFRYYQITLNLKDREKTSFTRPLQCLCIQKNAIWIVRPKNFPEMYANSLLIFNRKSIEVFMDDFYVFGTSFSICLNNLDTILKICMKTNLVLNRRKCYFMVTESIVLEHKISSKGIEVNKAKIEVIYKLPPPTSVKGVISFLNHARLYRRFIKDFLKIAKHLSNLLNKDKLFPFDESCLLAFNNLKEKLMTAPIVSAPN